MDSDKLIVKTENKIDVLGSEKKLSLKEKIALNRQKAKEEKERVQLINELHMHWANTMANIKCLNREKKTFTLHSVEVTNYGYKCRIYAPWGLALTELEKQKNSIESGVKCEFIVMIPAHNQFALVKFIKPEQVKCNEIPFKPLQLKPWEVYAGVDVSGEPVVFDVNKSPQILLAGQTRRGKNGSLDHMLVSWMHYCDEKEIQFYLFQCAKNDLIKYSECKQVRCYIERDLNKMVVALEYILKEMDRRSELFRPMMAKGDGNDNILHYNRKNKSEKLPYIYIVIDEFIELMPDNDLDDKDLKLKKNKILRYLQSIAQWGGSYGVNYIICHQKPEKALCPTFIKNQSSIRICFGFDDETCCQIVLGSGLMKMAHKLPPRKAFYSDNEKSGYLYTTDLREKIRPNLEKVIDPKHRTLFDDLEKLKKDFRIIQSNNPQTDNSGTVDLPNIEIPIDNIINIEERIKRTQDAQLKNNSKKSHPNDKEKETSATIVESIKEKTQENTHQLIIKKEEDIVPIKFDKVDPETNIKQVQELHENIKSIPNFVPYIDYSKFKNVKVTDQTKVSSKTEKPKKDRKESDDNKC
jgi:hypothetical protein